MKFEQLQSYTLVKEQDLPELASKGYVLKHNKSGARVFLLENEDDNKVFNIAFRTTPNDSTGVAHILEHSVLCGSEKYPAKDPFVELVKGSLNTFLNAMTYPDKTMYPIASCNDTDFKNLMSVYMDAVFHPNIYKNEKIFLQEGWHYELESEDKPIIYNGVVYNEMKGAFSSPETVLDTYTRTALFPHTTYAEESGGDPSSIPNLSYEEFLDFHRKYYHPSNSYIYLYGNMDMEERLKWLDKEYLSLYDAIAIDSEIVEESPFDKVVDKEIFYNITDDETEENKTYLSWNMVTGSVLDAKRYLAFQILEYALLNAPGAPLKKALLDAGIGQDVFGGYECGIRQTYFSIIAKDANKEQKTQFVSIIHETLEKIEREGINKKSLWAGINACEFKYREADFGRFPKGLMYGLQCFDSWLYSEEDPFMHLTYENTLKFLKEAVDGNYFEGLIKEYFLSNTHGAVITVIPKKGYLADQEAITAKRLEKYKKSLTKEQIQELIENTKALKAYQDKPSDKEELEKIPVLSVDDIDKKARPIENKWKKVGETDVLFHEMFTGGIGYLNLCFDAGTVEMEDIPYLSFLKTVLGYVDTKSFRYQELADEINIHTGGIDIGLSNYTNLKDIKHPYLKLEVRVKALYEKMEDALRLIQEVVFHSKIDDEKRLGEIIGEVRSRAQMRLLNAGHSAAVLRAASYFSEAAYLGEISGGIDYYHFLNKLSKDFEENKQEVIHRLKKVLNQVFTEENLLVSYTADESGFEALRKPITNFIGALPTTTSKKADWKFPLERKNEGFKSSSQVQYVARCGDFGVGGYDFNGAMRVLKVIMNYDYLWINLRVKGGAYGCMSGLSRDGQGYFVSYRDPNLQETNEIYNGIPEWLKSFTIDERDMTKYIIGTISDIDVPMNPYARGERGLGLYLSGITFEQIQKERDQILNTSQEDIRALAGPVSAMLSQDYLCVVGNDEKIENNKNMFKEVKQLL